MDRRLVTLAGLGEEPRDAHRALNAIARVIQRPLADARALAAVLPVILPRALPEADAERLVEELRSHGAEASTSPAAEAEPCATHGELTATDHCRLCDASSCSLCSALHGDRLCGACGARDHRKRRFFRIRVALLLTILAGVLVWGARDHLARKRRTDWSRPLVVGIVLVQLGELDADVIASLKMRVPALAERLGAELGRYRPTSAQPIELLTFGPVKMAQGPPRLMEDGALALVEHNYAVWRYVSAVDERASLDDDGLDARIYVVLQQPAHPALSFVEGASQEGGWVGMVEVELNAGMVDFTMFVVAHELFHTFGATDKYDQNGTRIPEGLAEPTRVPRYPQRYAEVMARMRPLGEGREALPDSLDELRVGPFTAQEIGWTAP